MSSLSPTHLFVERYCKDYAAELNAEDRDYHGREMVVSAAMTAVPLAYAFNSRAAVWSRVVSVGAACWYGLGTYYVGSMLAQTAACRPNDPPVMLHFPVYGANAWYPARWTVRKTDDGGYVGDVDHPEWRGVPRAVTINFDRRGDVTTSLEDVNA